MEGLHSTLQSESFCSQDRSPNSVMEYISGFGQYLDAPWFSAIGIVDDQRGYMIVNLVSITTLQWGLDSVLVLLW